MIYWVRNEKIEIEIILPVFYCRDDEKHTADLQTIKYRGYKQQIEH